ncbi:MAG: primosomal protein [Rhodocyclales bacterium]|nr:primosomal protein [Rhodocyclales bacterium]
MAGDWIKMRVDLRTHPKVVRMSSALRADRLRIIGGLWAVWSIFDAHSSDGILEGYSFFAIDEELGWKGFAKAMSDVEWLTEQDGVGLEAPRFEEHNGQSAKRRAMETERKRLERGADKVPKNSGQTSAPDADKSVTREEKRREEVKPTSSLRSDGAARTAQSSMLPEVEKPDESLLAAIFEVGLPVMLAGGCAEKSARSLLGQLRQKLGDLDALVTVEAMAAEKPLGAAAWVAAAIKAGAEKGQTFGEWSAACKAAGEPMISAYQPLLTYCEQVKLPAEFLNLAWFEFKRQHSAGGIYADRKSDDFRAKFRVAVERGYLGLWFVDRGTLAYTLTTAGMQAQTLMAAQKREAA